MQLYLRILKKQHKHNCKKNSTNNESDNYNLQRGKSPTKKQKPTIARIAAATATKPAAAGENAVIAKSRKPKFVKEQMPMLLNHL